MTITQAAVEPPSLRVLVIEEDDDSRELMADALHATGARLVTVAASAKGGLRSLRDHAYDLIVTDADLSEASGLAMLDQAKAEGILAGALVVVCSAQRRQRRGVLDRGALFILKPLNVEKLVDVVERARGERNGSGASAPLVAVQGEVTP